MFCKFFPSGLHGALKDETVYFNIIMNIFVGGILMFAPTEI